MVAIDRVAIPPADADGRDVAVVHEFREDPLRGPLGDTDTLGDVPEPDFGVLGEAEEHLGVVREEGPGPWLFRA